METQDKTGFFYEIQTLDFLHRRKPVKNVNLEETKLARCLNTFDLTSLGVASTLGAGIYVVSGSIIKNVSGPAIIISFIIAAIASSLAGFCYAEFGSRLPKSGSAYIYTYITVGEFMAFIIGWNLILEYVIGTASVASALSTYLDSLLDYKMHHAFRNFLPINIHGLGRYPDFFAFGVIIIITIILSIGVKESSSWNNILTGLNLTVISFIILYGTTKANIHNWFIEKSELPINGTVLNKFVCHDEKTCGSGGFFPFGFVGVLSGAAKCFYTFIGFDCIASTGEEVLNPQKAIPKSIIFTLSICTIAYCCTSGVLSLIVPYYLVDPSSPIPHAFKYAGVEWARYLVAFGAICSLTASTFGALFPLPRVLYAMGSDGLIFRFLALVNNRFKTPLWSVIISGIMAATMALLFSLEELVDMSSIGTLLAYSLVAISVLLIRYEPDTNDSTSANHLKESYFTRLFNLNNNIASKNTSYLVNVLMLIYAFIIIVVCLILNMSHSTLNNVLGIGALAFFLIICLIITVCIIRQPQNKSKIPFKTPFVPVLPLISVFINFYLMSFLSPVTWMRFVIWLSIGLIVYFSYGIKNGHRNCAKEIE